MQIVTKLYATLRDGRFYSRIMEFPDDATVFDIINSLNIKEEEAAIVFINNKHAGINTVLTEGDTLAIFPPIGGG
ncbi:MAG: MoaD/ThiS family protein [Spirochaetes bacterium]|nr:MoaD/ThiS family protein [Spirochaetota bacterium]